MEAILEDFQKAIKKLEESLALKENETTRDSSLMRFQLSFDLCWKLIKARARDEGLECYSPKSCFQTAFQMGIIDENENWLKMINDRNLITHTYNEPKAEEIYKNLKIYLDLFKGLLLKVKEKSSSTI